MSWIESHQSLSRHRKTIRAAKLLGCDRHKLIGHLHELWWWALDNADMDGTLRGIDPEEIGEAAGWKRPGFTDALVDAGFIDRDPKGVLSLHDWYDYAGKLNDRRAVTRASNRDRQQRRRDKLRDENVTLDVTVTRDNRDENVTVTTLPTNQPTNQPTTLSNESVRDALPLEVTEVRDLLLSKLSGKFQRDPVTWDEAEQFGRDFAGQHLAVSIAIEECRRTPESQGGGAPFPQRVRAFMPNGKPQPTERLYREEGIFAPGN